MLNRKILFAMAGVLALGAPVRADFLDISSLTDGGAGVGMFSGTLAGVGVTATLSQSGDPVRRITCNPYSVNGCARFFFVISVSL